VPKPRSKSVTPLPLAASSDLFGPPLLLAGEDPAKYDELLAQVAERVKPADVIEQMFVRDVVYATWELQRYRRLKTKLLTALSRKGLVAFLRNKLDYQHYVAVFQQSLAEILQGLVRPQEQPLSLAHSCAQGDRAARAKADEILTRPLPEAFSLLSLEKVQNDAKAFRAQKLAEQYVRHEAEAVELVDRYLVSHQMTMDDLVVSALTYGGAGDLTHLERFDRLAIMAEDRRNACLHEIERHRATLGNELRRAVQDIEDAEFQVIENKPAGGEKAA